MNFEEFGSRVMELQRANRLQEALALLDAHMAEFPAQAVLTGFTKARLHGALGQPEAALEAMRAVADAGGWLSERALINVPQLSAMRALPAFGEVASLFAERYASALATTRPELLTKCTAAEPKALVLSLHGNMSSNGGSAGAWAPAVAQGCCLGLTQSTEIVAPGMYVWDNWDQAEAQVVAHHAGLSSSAPLVLGGFSAGAGIAAWLALRGSVPARGFIAMGPWIPDMARVEAELPGAKERGVRGYILVGDQDHCIEHARELSTLLRKYEIPFEMELIPGLPHTFPADFGERFARGLQFVLGE